MMWLVTTKRVPRRICGAVTAELIIILCAVALMAGCSDQDPEAKNLDEIASEVEVGMPLVEVRELFSGTRHEYSYIERDRTLRAIDRDAEKGWLITRYPQLIIRFDKEKQVIEVKTRTVKDAP